MNDLAVAKDNLFSVLGERSHEYLGLLKSWFRGSLDKHSFDEKCHTFLTSTEYKLHNKFLVALFNRCSAFSGVKDTSNLLAKSKPVTFASTRKKLKLPKIHKDNNHQFYPSCSGETVAPIALSSVDTEKYYNSIANMSLCTSESALPDDFSAHLRVFVNVWECGLEGLDDDAVRLLNIATRIFVKNILTAIFTYKSSYRSVEGSNFKYAFGVPPINPFLKNSSPFLKVACESNYTDLADGQYFHSSDYIADSEMAEKEAVFQVACSTPIARDDQNCDPWNVNSTVTLEHVFHALKMYKNSVSNSMSIYMLGMNRIMSRLED